MKKIVFFSSICLCLPVSMKRLTQGFHIQKMKPEAQFNSEWETAPLSGEDRALLMRILIRNETLSEKFFVKKTKNKLRKPFVFF